MKKMKSSDFETVADILKTLDLKYNADYETKVQEFFSYYYYKIILFIFKVFIVKFLFKK